MLLLDELNKEQLEIWLNVDTTKHRVDEWFKKYHFLHKEPYIYLCDEFELAYNIDNYNYWFDLNKSEEAEEQELRLYQIKSLIYQLADKEELAVLNKKYMETATIKTIILGR